MRRVVMGLSGGMDSATLLGLLLDEGAEVHCCSFYYGSKHNVYERRAAENIVKHYRELGFSVFLYPIDLSEAFKNISSDLLLSGGIIPEGSYDAETMAATVVPGRNLIFSSIMAGLAESLFAQEVALGVHSGDHHIYPDCRVEFIKALDSTVYLSSDRKVSVTTPLLELNKAEILMMGYSDFVHKVPYHLTRTCYKDQELSCGKCGACMERLEAFAYLMVADPIPYEKHD